MADAHANNYPKLHNAVWPGLVGKMRINFTALPHEEDTFALVP